MTPVDQRLDPDLVTKPSFSSVFRLTRRKYSVLSGIGASLAPGRWNRLGEEAIYTSLERSNTILERLVHTPKDTIPSDMAWMTIRIAGDWSNSAKAGKKWIKQPDARYDYGTGASFRICSSLADAAVKVPLDKDSFAMAVPSVVAPVWNIILFPARRGFWDHVSLEDVVPFTFDPRLFPEQAIPETAQ